MRLVKYTHACVRLEKDGGVLVIDPGAFSEAGTALEGADAVVITHEHPDHLDADALKAAAAANPDLTVLTNPELATTLDVGVRVTPVAAGDEVTAAGFALRGYGSRHAHIHGDLPDLANIGVLVDEELYYPGDSWALPGVPVQTLLLPTSAPWVKVGEAIDFALAVRPERAFSTHDAMLNEIGARFT